MFWEKGDFHLLHYIFLTFLVLNRYLLLKMIHGSIGSNLRDFAISLAEDKVYLACGAPYKIQEVQLSTMEPLRDFTTGAYPTAVALDQAREVLIGVRAYASNSEDDMFQFDLNSGGLVESFKYIDHPQFDSDGQSRGVTISRDGIKAFVITGDSYYFDPHMQIQVIHLAEVDDSPPKIQLDPDF